MKKMKIIIPLLLLISTLQLSADEFGIRGSVGTSSGWELNYIRPVNRNVRVDLGVGYDNSEQVGLIGAVHWLWGLGSGWQWFVGPAIMTAIGGDEIPLYAGGQIGLEFDFDKAANIPLIAGVDTRPLFSGGSTVHTGFALSLRFKF